MKGLSDDRSIFFLYMSVDYRLNLYPLDKTTKNLLKESTKRKANMNDQEKGARSGYDDSSVDGEDFKK
jgi:hypothetical protein